MSFPPVSVYPSQIDSDYTLFLVYNTTESKLCKDNSAWSDEIDIVPTIGWADNGFGNIEGELFYYDAVDKNFEGKVIRLKNCARQLTGATQYNRKGTWVRSFVIAEHHNQLVDAALKIEDFVGFNFDPRMPTLDWRIRNLASLNVITDDYNCPDINFTFNIIENNPETGILASYAVEVAGSIDSFRLDFGDGQFTTSVLTGRHQYALNAVVDPTLTATNQQCQVVQTPIKRDNPTEPPVIIQNVFDIPIPEVPGVPDFTFVPCNVPEPDINLPPLVFPCISLENQFINIPSIIIGPNISMLSQVQFLGLNNPIIITQSVVAITGLSNPFNITQSVVAITGLSNSINITQSVVTIVGNINIPSVIFVDIPPTIIIDPPIPPTIVVIADISDIDIGLNIGELPRLEVDWGSPPPMEVALTMARQVQTPRMFGQDDNLKNEFGEEFADLFEASDHIKVEYENIGLPSEIRIIPPNMPEVIRIDATEVHIPDNILIHLDSPIPDRIEVVGNLPTEIRLEHNLPSQIALVCDIPHKIEVELNREIPNKIVIEVSDIPDTIVVTGIPDFIEVRGIPDVISIVGMPEGIKLLPPDEPVEMVYKGSPIPVEVKVTMSEMMKGAAEGQNCYAFVPCGPAK